jgi:acyl-CoA synthetase (AMP-forming)/AMP-acid ligase II
LVGGTRVPVDPGAPADETAAVFAAAGVDAVLTDREHFATRVHHLLLHDDAEPLSAPGSLDPVTVSPETTLMLYPRMASRGELMAVPISYANWAATPTDLRRAIEVVGPVLVQLYGRFEGGWPLSILSPEDHLAEVGGEPLLGRSCGRPIAQTEINIRPVSGQPGDAGELCVRNGMVVREAADPDGWCALGDIVHRDKQGYLYLGGRLDGMINTGSYHVYPREVQDAIAAVAGVREALVRGEPDPVWGHAVTAYVVLAPEAPADLIETLRPALGRRLASYKIPKRFHFVSSLREVPVANGTGG